MNLRDSLRAAVSDPPPSRIDLDGLSRKEHRERRMHQFAWAGAGLSVVAVVAVVGAVLATPPASAPPDLVPAAPPSTHDKLIPTPTVRAASPEEEATAAALSLVLVYELGLDYGVPPGATFTFYPPGSWLAAPQGHYEALWMVGETKMSLMVFRAPIPQEESCVKQGPDISCERFVNPDGSVTYLAEDRGGATPTRTAEHYRLDNTVVKVSATSVGALLAFDTNELRVAAEHQAWKL